MSSITYIDPRIEAEALIYDSDSHTRHEAAVKLAETEQRDYSHIFWQWRRTWDGWQMNGHYTVTPACYKPSWSNFVPVWRA